MQKYQYLYDSRELEQLAYQAKRKKSLEITNDTLWLVSLDMDEKSQDGKKKQQTTLMISLDGKIEIAEESLTKVLNRTRTRGLTRLQMRDVFTEMTDKQQRRFPLITLDLLMGTLDGTDSYGCIWFNVMHIFDIEQAATDNPSLSLVTMRDESQWIVPRKLRNLQAYIHNIAELYRTYVLAAVKLLGTCQKTFFIENKFDTPYLREQYLNIIGSPCLYASSDFILIYSKQLLERNGAQVIFPEKKEKSQNSQEKLD